MIHSATDDLAVARRGCPLSRDASPAAYIWTTGGLDTLPPGTVDGYRLPVADGSVRNRSGIRAAMQQLNAAGYQAEGGVMRRADGTPLTFSILLSKGSRENLAIAELYTQALKRLGITAQIETVDDAQFVARQPMGRVASAEEIAALVVYLASDDASYTAGQTLNCSGGLLPY